MATKYVYMRGFAEYAKVFERNMDKGSDDPDAHEAQRKVASEGGQTCVNFFPASDEEYAKLLDIGWKSLCKATMGNEMLKEGKVSYGIGKYVTFKRPFLSPFKNPDGSRKPGWEGAPEVLDFRGDKESWDTSVDIGKGSEVTIKLCVYDLPSLGKGQFAARLEALAVHVLVPYEGSEGNAINSDYGF
jgi:hypothetical protein